jgi:hypothetical protein
MAGADLPRDDFVDEWNRLERRERRRLRRLVQLGRPPSDPAEAQLAVLYARFQQSRPWMRFFWLWFVPGLVLALGVAARIHPILIGVVLAAGIQAVLTRRNLGRVSRGT